MSALLTQCPCDTVQTGTGKVDPARKLKCDIRARNLRVFNILKKVSFNLNDTVTNFVQWFTLQANKEKMLIDGFSFFLYIYVYPTWQLGSNQQFKLKVVFIVLINTTTAVCGFMFTIPLRKSWFRFTTYYQVLIPGWGAWIRTDFPRLKLNNDRIILPSQWYCWSRNYFSN